MATNNLTPTEIRIFKVLQDQQSHHEQDVIDCILTSGGKRTMRVYIHNLRQKLNPMGMDIVTERWHDATRYRLARIVTTK